MQPETRYADSGGVNIAYQVLGDGPRDLVVVMGFVSNIEVFWEEPALARFLSWLASFSRVILFDKRGNCHEKSTQEFEMRPPALVPD